MTSLANLKRICQEATPGPWYFDPNVAAIVVVQKHLVKAVADFGKIDNEENNAQFITTFNPTFVAKLLAVVEAAKGLQHYSRHGANEGWVDWDKYFDPTMKAIDALEEV